MVRYEEDEDAEPTPARSPSESTGNWKSKLNTVFLQLPRTSGSGGNIQTYAAFLLMEKVEYYYASDYVFTPYIVKAKNWNVLQEFASAGIETINDLLDNPRVD